MRGVHGLCLVEVWRKYVALEVGPYWVCLEGGRVASPHPVTVKLGFVRFVQIKNH